MQYLDEYSFTQMIIVLQLFDEMPKCEVFVWNATVSRCTNTGPDFVDCYLSNGMNMMCYKATLFNMLSLCYLEFWKTHSFCG